MRIMYLILTALAATGMMGCLGKGDDERPACNEEVQVLEPMFAVVEPSAYLPAFPGSWWVYSDESRVETESGYFLSTVLATSWDTNHGVVRCCEGKRLRLPVYAGYSLYGYTRIRPDASGTNGAVCSERLLSENLGDEYRWGGSHYGRTKSRTILVGASVTLGSGATYSPCVVVKRVEGLHANSFDQASRFTLEWYARDVGLVRRINRISTTDSVVVDLIAHYIAR